MQSEDHLEQGEKEGKKGDKRTERKRLGYYV